MTKHSEKQKKINAVIAVLASMPEETQIAFFGTKEDNVVTAKEMISLLEEKDKEALQWAAKLYRAFKVALQFIQKSSMAFQEFCSEAQNLGDSIRLKKPSEPDPLSYHHKTKTNI